MKQHPLKGWRKILAVIAGGAVSAFVPGAAPFVLPLIKTYLIAQGAADAAEWIGKKTNGQ